jgi:hypothetical protein
VEFQPRLFQGQAIHSALEGQFIAKYLQDQGLERSDLRRLPEELVKKIMAQACQYASLKLAEIEARSKFIQKIT